MQGAEEQLWLLKVLVDGLKCKDDVRMYERHKVFSHVAALVGSTMLEPRAKVKMSLLLERQKGQRELFALCAIGETALPIPTHVQQVATAK